MEQVTIKDIARICKVGVSTVSRAINNHPDINPETKEMVLQTIKDYNYVPNNSARNLKRSDAKTIAILVKGMTNPFFYTMIKIMEEEVNKKRYAMVIRHVEPHEDELEVAIELVKEKRLRGIVFLGGLFTHTEATFDRLEVPFVLSTVGKESGYVNLKEYSTIAVDDVKESYKAVEYLIKLGHTNIATITAPEGDKSIGMLRLKGYQEALDAYGIERNSKLIG